MHCIIPGMLGLLTAVLSVAIPLATCDSRPESLNERRYRIMFYNVENLFDIYDDSLTNDEEFTPSGTRHWTAKRYHSKLSNIYKVIVAVGGWKPPDIIGFSEIENRQVLHDLVNNTPLSKYAYRIIHEDSPDRRGIDVALIYNSQTVQFIDDQFIPVVRQDLFTRDILYSQVLLGTDTCHIFVNHWPSRSSGQLESEPGRFAAAHALRSITDSLFNHVVSPKILILGDFNDDPADESINVHLGARNGFTDTINEGLYNITGIFGSGDVKGTLKYQGNWNVFDQIMVSGKLLSDSAELVVSSDGYKIFQEPFLLDVDEQFNGHRPFRTYNGYRYQGGFSDHLPVYVDLISP